VRDENGSEVGGSKENGKCERGGNICVQMNKTNEANQKEALDSQAGAKLHFVFIIVLHIEVNIEFEFIGHRTRGSKGSSIVVHIPRSFRSDFEQPNDRILFPLGRTAIYVQTVKKMRITHT